LRQWEVHEKGAPSAPFSVLGVFFVPVGQAQGVHPGRR